MDERKRQTAISVFGSMIGVSICLLLWAAFQPDDPFVASGYRLTVTDGSKLNKIYYKIGKEVTLDTRSLGGEAASGAVKDLGIRTQYHYLKDEAYVTLVNKYQSVKRCPASFLNRNAKHLLVLSEDPALTSSLQGASAKEGTAVLMKGSFLELESGKLGGASLKWAGSAVRFFLLRGLEVAGHEQRGRTSLLIGDLELRQ